MMENPIIENQSTVEKANRTFRVVIKRTEENDGYVADIPSLQYCMAFGDTPEEALDNLHEALEGTLEVMHEDGVPIPDDRNSMETMITVPVKKSLTSV